ncbi:MAG: ATP phosphoribosyltransferase [Thermosynechococcaceae cyanobacterium]
MSDRKVRLALPSKGALGKLTMDLLANIGLKVNRPNDRQYVATIPAVPEIEVLFQRAADIFVKVHEGSADLGVTGYDVVSEDDPGDGSVITAYETLGYGKCEVVLGVPNSWIDVTTIEDLAELTLLWKAQGKPLRIVTKYKNLTKKLLFDRNITNFVLVDANGALEAAPSMGYADMISDVTSTGTTLRENNLKQLAGGKILKSQACLIANRRALKSPVALEITQQILERIEANQEAKKYTSITANVRAGSMDEVGALLTNGGQLHELTGMRGPTISKVYTHGQGNDDWYAVTVVVNQEHLFQAVQHLRRVEGQDITVSPPRYVFGPTSKSAEALLLQLSS